MARVNRSSSSDETDSGFAPFGAPRNDDFYSYAWKWNETFGKVFRERSRKRPFFFHHTAANQEPRRRIAWTVSSRIANMNALPPSRNAWRFRLRVAAVVALLVATPLLFAQSAAPTLAQQRDAFRAAYTAAQNGQDWRTLARGIQNYPLYPYLEAAAL